jgi:hypothetical membrane protein
MRVVPWWTLISSACAPVVLIGGWAVAASLQPAGYDPMVASISALAANGAVDPWLMSGALYILGVCHMATALGLRPAAVPGRVALACGGVASIVVGLSPEPLDGTSLRHLISTGLGFTLLALFPILASVRGAPLAWPLRPAVGRVATALMAAGAAWFLLELHGHGIAGLAERVLTAAQTIWPLLIVVACVRAQPQPLARATSVPAAVERCEGGEGGR